MPRRRPLRPLSAVVLLGAALLAVAPALSAQASLGSVPVAVSDYVASGQMQARLSQVYGPGATKGSGVDFDATTKAGPISRVYEWTDDRYAHADSDHPIQLTNYWTVPITIADAPVGVAAVWINPTSDQPELAEFTKSAPLATALAAVPADAALVHDAATAAWYAVATDTATPLVEGRSGIAKPTPVADLALSRGTPAPQPGTEANTGIGLAVGVLVLLVLVIVATVLLPRFLKPRPRPRPAVVAGSTAVDPVETTAPEEPAVPRPEDPVVVSTVSTVSTAPAEAQDTTDPATAPAPRPPAPRTPATPRTPAKPRTTTPRSPAKPRTPVTQKPAASKPTGTKPASTRTAATKPPAAKPPASKPPTPRRRPEKPPEDTAPEA